MINNPYIVIALRMFLCWAATDTYQRDAYSVPPLKRVKLYLKPFMNDGCLNSSTILNIETQLFSSSLSYDEIIEDIT